MSEKRFELSESEITDYRIYDYKQEDAYFISCAKHTAECLVNLLNSLNYENEELEISIQLFEDDVKRLQEQNKQLQEKLKKVQEKLKDANDEVGYWKEMVARYRDSARLDLEECTILQGNKKYVGKVSKFVKYENHSSIDLYDLKEAKVVEDE